MHIDFIISIMQYAFITIDEEAAATIKKKANDPLTYDEVEELIYAWLDLDEVVKTHEYRETHLRNIAAICPSWPFKTGYHE